MKPLKVAVVIPTHTNLKSSLHVLLDIYEYLIRTKNLKAAIFTDSKNNVDYPGFKTVRIKGIDHGTIWSRILFLLGIPRYCYKDLIGKLEGYDIIESSNPEFYIFAYQSYLAAKKYHAKLILRTSQTVEGFFLFKLSKYLVLLFVKKSYDYASWLFFTNNEAAERAKNLGFVDKNSKRIVITGHAIDTNTFKPLDVKKSKKKIILSVAGLYKIKGHHIIIEAFSKIEDGIDAELWIVGDGYCKKSLQELAENLGISSRIRFLGSKTKKELARVYNMANVFVLANYQEITPAVNEALACGIPVVVMECGGRKFVIPDESYGFVAKRFDTEDMAEKMEILLKNKALAKKIAAKGRRYVLDNFSVEIVAEKFYECFIK